MNRKLSIVIFLVFLSVFSKSFSQQVAGHWYGVGIIDASKDYTNYMSELVLKQKGRSVSGSLNYYFKDTLMKVPVNGIYDVQTRKLRIRPFPMNLLYLCTTIQTTASSPPRKNQKQQQGRSQNCNVCPLQNRERF